MTENNLLISNFDRKIEHGLRFVSGVRIVERYSYTPIQGGYDETVIVEGDRERLREAVARGLDYARDYGLTVKVNNPLVREDLRSGIFDTTGLLVVDCVQRTIVDDRDLHKKGVSNMKDTPEALKEIAEYIIVNLNKYDDCWGWDCSECPFHLKKSVRDSWGCMTQCGWLLLATAAMKILEK
jgi:hypothetical protein